MTVFKALKLQKMVKLEDYLEVKGQRTLRTQRYFSESFKRKKVAEIERNITGVSEICKEYQVSRAAIYRWIYKYSIHMKKGVKQVVEAKSDTAKIRELKDQIKELELIVGQKQLMLDFKDKMIELAEEEYRVDIKKKLGTRLKSGSGLTGKSTLTK